MGQMDTRIIPVNSEQQNQMINPGPPSCIAVICKCSVTFLRLDLEGVHYFHEPRRAGAPG